MYIKYIVEIDITIILHKSEVGGKYANLNQRTVSNRKFLHNRPRVSAQTAAHVTNNT